MRKHRKGSVLLLQEKLRSLSLGSFGLRSSHVLYAHLKGVAYGGEGSRAFGVRVSSPGVGEIRVAHCGVSSSNLLCIQKRNR
jgi:hypothetical protein